MGLDRGKGRREDGDRRPENGDWKLETEVSTGQLPLSKGVWGMWEA
jgi:hypothetical protein